MLSHVRETQNFLSKSKKGCNCYYKQMFDIISIDLLKFNCTQYILLTAVMHVCLKLYFVLFGK